MKEIKASLRSPKACQLLPPWLSPPSPWESKQTLHWGKIWKIPQMPFQLFGQCHKRAEHCPALKATSHNRAQGMCAARWRMWTMHLSESGASVSKALSATSAVFWAQDKGFTERHIASMHPAKWLICKLHSSRCRCRAIWSTSLNERNVFMKKT